MYTKEEMGRLLKRLREEHMWSIVELSEISGVDKNAISDAERGIRRTRNATLKKLAAAYQVNPQYLIGVTTDPRIPGQPGTADDGATEDQGSEDRAQKSAA